MKVTNLILGLPLVVSAATLQVRERQAGQPLDQPAPTMRKNAQRKYFTFGPYSLKVTAAKDGSKPKASGGGMGGMGMMGEADAQNFAASMAGSQFCGTCTVLSGQIKITNAAGQHLTPDKGGLYVHHILTNAMTNQPSFVRSSLGGLGMGFVGAGDDNGNTPFIYTPRDGSLDSGFWISPTDRFTAQIVLVNYNTAPQQVYVNYDLEYLPGHIGKRVKSSLLSASGIGNPRTSKTGAVNTTSSALPFTEPGHIVLAKGHLHDGGSAMYMKITGSQTFTCVSKATYGGKIHGSDAETISDMTDCNSGPVKVNVGDSMYMTAEYDLKKHPLRGTTSGGEGSSMGMFRVIFAPEKTW